MSNVSNREESITPNDQVKTMYRPMSYWTANLLEKFFYSMLFQNPVQHEISIKSLKILQTFCFHIRELIKKNTFCEIHKTPQHSSTIM